MSKKITFAKGDCVIGKKWSGAEIKGIYEYTYDDGSHCVLEVNSGRQFNVKQKELSLASEEEAINIKKLFKENKLKLKEKVNNITITNNDEEELNLALAAEDNDDDD